MRNEELDLRYVVDTVENEGFYYAMKDYSDFKEVKDEEFHKLRKEFLEAGERLGKYLRLDDEHYL